MGDIKLADWAWLPLPKLFCNWRQGLQPLHLTLAAESKDVALRSSPEQPYFHGRFPFKYLNDREHGSIKASREPSTRRGNGQIKPLMGEEGVSEGPLCLKPLAMGPALQKLYRHHSSLHIQNNLVPLERNQDLCSMTYSLNLTFFICWHYEVI